MISTYYIIESENDKNFMESTIHFTKTHGNRYGSNWIQNNINGQKNTFYSQKSKWYKFYG